MVVYLQVRQLGVASGVHLIFKMVSNKLSMFVQDLQRFIYLQVRQLGVASGVHRPFEVILKAFALAARHHAEAAEELAGRAEEIRKLISGKELRKKLFFIRTVCSCLLHKVRLNLQILYFF
jgi:hypothetical protein